MRTTTRLVGSGTVAETGNAGCRICGLRLRNPQARTSVVTTPSRESPFRSSSDMLGLGADLPVETPPKRTS